MTHSIIMFAPRSFMLCRPFLRVIHSFRLDYLALASATSNGIGECQLSRGRYSTAAAVRSSSGMSCLINPLLFAFRKAVAVLLSPCLWLSRPAVLPSLCPHCPPSNATDPPLLLLHQAIRTDGLRHLLVCLSPSLSHCMCHVPFACL